MKIYLFAALLCLSIPEALAQTDSIAVVNADWEKERIAGGVRLKTFSFNNNLFGSNQNVSILEIKPRKKLMFDLGYEDRQLKPTSKFGESSGAIAALNGTFFDIANGGSVDFIKSDGIIINESRIGKNGRSGHQQSALVFKNGRIEIAKWDGSESWERNLEGEDVMVTGPLLILDQQDEILDPAIAFNKVRHPRTALAITKNNRVLLITVDGRSPNSAGMSLFELTKLMRWLNADDAINLDGGGSTTLWTEESGVVNYPSDNKKWDHDGERKVANVVLVKKR